MSFVGALSDHKIYDIKYIHKDISKNILFPSENCGSTSHSHWTHIGLVLDSKDICFLVIIRRMIVVHVYIEPQMLN